MGKARAAAEAEKERRMNKKENINLWCLLAALVFGISVFFMPVKVYAQGAADTTPPSLQAELAGDRLRIEAEDEGLGVDAVFVGGRRVNYRVDSVVELNFGDYAKDAGRSVKIWAVDFAGNESETVEILNPYYVEADAGGRAFTPDGQAAVTDHAADEDGKEFYVFTTPEGNVFYLVIDRQRDSENVYFLNAVTEDDLAALAEKGGKASEGSESAAPEPAVCICTDKCEAGYVNAACPVCRNELRGCLGKEAAAVTEEQEKSSGGNGAAAVFIFLAAIAAGGAGYYLKIYRPKQELDDAEDLDDLLDDGEDEVNEDGPDRETEDGFAEGLGDEEVYLDYYEGNSGEERGEE